MNSPTWRDDGTRTLDLDGFRRLDKERRELITANEQRKAQRNKASDEIARLKKDKQNADALIAEMKVAFPKRSRRPTSRSPISTPAARNAPDHSQYPAQQRPYGTGAEGNRKFAAGARRRNLISSQSRTGKSVNALGFWILKPQRALPALDSRCIKAGEHGSNVRLRISSLMFTRGNMATPKSCRLFW